MFATEVSGTHPWNCIQSLSSVWIDAKPVTGGTAGTTSYSLRLLTGERSKHPLSGTAASAGTNDDPVRRVLCCHVTGGTFRLFSKCIRMCPEVSKCRERTLCVDHADGRVSHVVSTTCWVPAGSS